VGPAHAHFEPHCRSLTGKSTTYSPRRLKSQWIVKPPNRLANHWEGSEPDKGFSGAKMGNPGHDFTLQPLKDTDSQVQNRIPIYLVRPKNAWCHHEQ
jgi:hypothetical protein